MRRLILDSLRYWVAEMHVDGFRFDLASVLSRDEDGNPLAAAADHLGHRHRPGPGRHEADRRGLGRRAGCTRSGRSRAIAGWSGTAGSGTTSARSSRATPAGRRGGRRTAARRAPTSTPHLDREPQKTSTSSPATTASPSNDLVSYDRKHNEANGEDNRDGSDQNLSWNCGVEGPTDDPAIEALRSRQVKNLLTLELLAVGVPMLHDGRRGPTDPARQQQRLLPGRRAQLVRLDGSSTATPTCCGSPRADRGPAPAQELFDLPADVSLMELLAPVADRLARRRASGGRTLSDSSRSHRPHRSGAEQRRPPRHPQRVLGAARLRGPAARAGDRAGWRRIIDTSLASPGRLRRRRRGRRGRGRQLSGGAAVGRGPRRAPARITAGGTPR